MTKIYPAIGFSPVMWEGHEYTKVAFADFAANDNTDSSGYYTKILTIYEKPVKQITRELFQNR